MDMAFFARRWYSLMTLGSALDGGASSDPSTISQRSMEANTISILNFQRLKFSPLNFSMILALSPSNDAILHSNLTSLPTPKSTNPALVHLQTLNGLQNLKALQNSSKAPKAPPTVQTCTSNTHKPSRSLSMHTSNQTSNHATRMSGPITY